MPKQLIHVLLLSVFAAGLTALGIIHFLMAAKQKKSKEKASNNHEDTASFPSAFPVTAIKATVIKQSCFVEMIGDKTPKTVKKFLVSFQTENGEILNLNVREEMYDGFEQGQTGILSLVDGELYGFELEDND